MSLKNDLNELSRWATQGIWGKYQQDKFPINWNLWDTSHDMSALNEDGSVLKSKISSWKHANDAAFAEILVNAYRQGKLEVIE